MTDVTFFENKLKLFAELNIVGLLKIQHADPDNCTLMPDMRLKNEIHLDSQRAVNTLVKKEAPEFQRLFKI